MNRQPIAMPAFTFAGISGEAYPRMAIPDPARVNPVLFPEIWKPGRQR
jgi:hypothetical protein